MDAYRCRICGHTSSLASAMVDCPHCLAKNCMIPNNARDTDTVTMPRDCSDDMLREFCGAFPFIDPGTAASMYAKFIRLGRMS